jgi:Zn-finger nucleic acid-binding protein
MTTLLCPVCQAPFKEVIKEGILIDVCTQCKGVWLDRGELEKLLSVVRVEQEAYAPARPDAPQGRPGSDPHYREPHPQQRRRDFDDDDGDDDFRRSAGYGQGYGQGGYRKKSKLESIFGMFD